MDWEQGKPNIRVKQFMNILEQLPRLCSPTICGTLSQPTTRSERAKLGAETFEWSLEQKAILSPANITTDIDNTGEWQANIDDLNPSWRQQESEQFFSQRTIAPSPLVATPAKRLGRPRMTTQDETLDEEDEDESDCIISRPLRHIQDEYDDDDDEDMDNQDDTRDDRVSLSDFRERDEENDCVDYDGHYDNEDARDDQVIHNDQDECMWFSPQPLKSSQTQQTMEIFSPESFDRVMEDENTLQSTPKTTGSVRRTRTRAHFLD